MNLVMPEPTKTTEGVRLTVAISHDDYERLAKLKARLRRVRGKQPSTQELASEWVSQGIATAEEALAAEEARLSAQ